MNEFFPLIKVNEWYFEMGIIPNTHKYVFNMCVEDFEIIDQQGYNLSQNAPDKILNVFDEKSIYKLLETFRRVYIQVRLRHFY